MSASFQVTPESVAEQSGQASRVADILTKLPSSPPIDDAALGQGGVGAVVQEFFTKWDYEIGQVANAMNDLSGNLAKAAEFYAKTDANACVAVKTYLVPAGGGMRG
jgi:hypothetical protein